MRAEYIEVFAVVAKFLEAPARTLQRHLLAHRTTLTKLSDDTRHEIARRLLTDTRTSINGITATLDYADATAFTRVSTLDTHAAGSVAEPSSLGLSDAPGAKNHNRASLD